MDGLGNARNLHSDAGFERLAAWAATRRRPRTGCETASHCCACAKNARQRTALSHHRRAAGEHLVSLRNQKAFMESQVRMMIMLGIPFFYYWRSRDWRFESSWRKSFRLARNDLA